MTRAEPGRRTAILLLLATLACATRGPRLTARDLWYDEQVTLVDSQGVVVPSKDRAGSVFSSTELRARGSLLAIARYSATHDQPVYVSAIHLWTRWAGVTEGTLRAPSLILGVATVALVTMLGWRLLGFGPGVLAGILLAVSPLHVHYSQEARTYAAAVFLVVATVLLGLYLRPESSPWVFASYGALASLVPALHLLAGAALIPQGLVLVARRELHQGLLKALLGAVVVLALVAPLGLLDSIGTAHRASGVAYREPPPEIASWARPATPAAVALGAGSSLTRLLGIEYFSLGLRGRTLAPLSLALVFLALFAGLKAPTPTARFLLLGGALLPLLVSVALSVVYGHVVPLQDRYAAWCLPFFSLLLAHGACRLGRSLSWWVAFLLVGLSTFFVVIQQIAPPPRLSLRSEEARAVGDCSGAEDIVVAEAWPAAILSAWLERPVPIALGPPPEERAAWFVGAGVVCRLAATRCEEKWQPCGVSRGAGHPH